MRLGLDARILCYPKCGISTYVYNLAKNLIELDKDLEIFLFSDGTFNPQYDASLNSPRIRKVVFASSKKEKRRWAQKFLPQQLNKYKIDLYHATWNNCVPFRRDCPCVLTIHDLAPWIFRRTFRHIRKEAKYKLKHFLCTHMADLILTDSFKVKQDVSRLCWVKSDKVRAVHLGIEEEFKKEIETNRLRNILAGYKLEQKKYLIDSCGVSHYRRNSIFALEGFYQFLTQRDNQFHLVYTGQIDEKDKQYRSLIKRINQLGLEERVIFTGWVANQELKALISGALVSIIPSLYEGFGLPILEAFASNTPVIATNRGSIPEVAQDAAIIVDPFDSQALGQQIKELIENEELSKKLIARARERLKYFDWRKTASQTLDIYKELVRKP